MPITSAVTTATKVVKVYIPNVIKTADNLRKKSKTIREIIVESRRSTADVKNLIGEYRARRAARRDAELITIKTEGSDAHRDPEADKLLEKADLAVTRAEEAVKRAESIIDLAEAKKVKQPGKGKTSKRQVKSKKSTV